MKKINPFNLNFEDKIRANITVVYSIIALVCIIAIYYSIYFYKQIQKQQNELDKSYKVLNLTNDVIQTLQSSQTESNFFILTQNKEYLSSYYNLLNLSKDNIDSLKININDKEQLNKLKAIYALFEEKEKIILTFSEQITDNNPLISFSQKLKKQYQRDTSILVKKTKEDTIYTKDTVIREHKKKKLIKRIAEVFVPEQENTSLVSNITTVIKIDTIIQKPNQIKYLIDSIEHISNNITTNYSSKFKSFESKFYSLILADQKISEQISTLLSELHKKFYERVQNNLSKKEDAISKAILVAVIGGIISLILITSFIILIFRNTKNSLLARIELEKAKQRTEELMESRHKLLLSISHDIKAPLSSIIGYLNLWEMQDLSLQEHQRLNSMQNSSKHILSLLTNLLEFSSLEQKKSIVQSNTIELIPFFLETLDLFKPLAQEKNLLLKHHFEIKVCQFISSDLLKLSQIINNLISNAIKYTFNGEILLDIKENFRDNLYYLTISVRDTGIGIAKEKLHNIFDAFSRIESINNSKIEGSGLGLFVVKGLVDLLQGEIRISSKEDEGSCFEVTLPIKGLLEKEEEIQKDKVLAPFCEREQKGLGLRILVAEDDISQATLMQQMLKLLGHKATICYNKIDLQKQLSQIGNFDLIMTDMEMGDIDGYFLIDKIRKSYNIRMKNIPVIMVSASSSISLEEIKAKGFNGLLPKPFNLQELKTMIDSFIQFNEEMFSLEELSLFLDEDTDAINNIISTFIEATRENIIKLNQSVYEDNFAISQSLSHKMLPMCKQLNISGVIPVLEKMEDMRNKPNDDYHLWKEDIKGVIYFLKEVIKRLETNL